MPSRLRSLPGARRSWRGWPPPATAMPAESYPRYSRRARPSMITGTHALGPMYPTIPHIRTEYRVWRIEGRVLRGRRELILRGWRGLNTGGVDAWRLED